MKKNYFTPATKAAKKTAKKPTLRGAKTNDVALPNCNLYLKGQGLDSNGNSTVKLTFPNSTGFSIQTNGTLPKTNRILSYSKSVKNIDEKDLATIEKEVVNYVKSFGSPTQKKKLKTYGSLKGLPSKRKIARSTTSTKLKNGYTSRLNPLFKMFVVSHPEIGAGIAMFKRKSDVIKYANNG